MQLWQRCSLAFQSNFQLYQANLPKANLRRKQGKRATRLHYRAGMCRCIYEPHSAANAKKTPGSRYRWQYARTSRCSAWHESKNIRDEECWEGNLQQATKAQCAHEMTKFLRSCLCSSRKRMIESRMESAAKAAAKK